MNAIPCDTKIKSARSFLCECADLCKTAILSPQRPLRIKNGL